MDNWIDLALKGMGVIAFVCMAVVAAPVVIFFAMLAHAIITG